MDQTAQAIKTLLEQDIAHLQELEQLLQEEHATLTTTSPDQLLALAQRKQLLFETLESQHTQREQLLQQAGIESAVSADCLAYFTTLEKTQPALARELTDLWQRFITQLQETQRRNAINGNVIAASQNQTRRLRTILQGRNPDGIVYGPRGQLHSSDLSE